MTIRSYVELMKLRIGLMVALMAVMGYVAVADRVDPLRLAVLSLAMLLGSASSSVFNHFYDRDIDRLMTRTCRRPLARGQSGRPGHVLWLAGFLLVAGCGLALMAFNAVVALHLFLGAFFYAIVYTVWLKRRTWLNIVIGGAAGSFAVLAGGAAVDPGRWLLPFLLSITLFLWTPSHFWSLAILLKDDYVLANVPMLPVVHGDKATAKAILINSVLLVASSLLPVAFGVLGWAYGVGAAGFGCWFLWNNGHLLRTPTHAWARKNFFGSMIYLVGLFAAVLIDVNL
ncbi:heme o synthase [Telmatospirillum sp.]|uniref:heme o synthase n=1 Tax=Telmatospirillum sp. TaxID=2079197 RepID=UPI00284B59B1|nr:heme o synthase [Telmatospirillum sp.]MDR3440281.1 heme o synthase [Telmatospirillum sp.]